MYKGKFEKLCRQSMRQMETNDCTVKAIAIVCRTNYSTAHKTLAELGRKSRKGCYRMPQYRAIEQLGFKMVKAPNEQALLGKTITQVAKSLDRGFYLVWVRGHVAAVHNTVIHDWTKGRRHRVQQIAKIERIKP